MRTNDLIVSRIDARNGAMAIVPNELDGAIATNDFPIFEINTQKILPSYLRYCLFQPLMLKVYEKISRGSTNRRRLIIDLFLKLTIPVPKNLDVQLNLAERLNEAEQNIATLRAQLGKMQKELEKLVGASIHYVMEGK